MIDIETLRHYGLAEEGDETYEDVVSHYESESAFAVAFLTATDHVPNKITESMVMAIHEAESFETWAQVMYEEYHKIIEYRGYARNKV